MKCIVIRHLKFEDFGIFEKVLVERGFEIEYLDAGLHNLDTRNWDEVDLVVVLGGPIGVYEVADYPWLRQEIDIIGRRLPRTGQPLAFAWARKSWRLHSGLASTDLTPHQAFSYGSAALAMQFHA